MRRFCWRIGAWITFAVACAASALNAGTPPPEAAYAGTLQLAVDLTDIDRRIFRVREEIPVVAGPLALHYPKWLPGNHAPSGPIEQLAGLTITANGQRIAWKRDALDVFTFHLEVPDGVSRLVLEFQFASPLDPAQGRIVVTPQMLGLQWNTVVLYPAGHAADRIMIEPRIVLPDRWQFASALQSTKVDGSRVAFKPVSLETLVDSPLFAGRHFRRFELDASRTSPVRLNVVADAPHLLDPAPGLIEAHRMLVAQADRLFGVRHFEHYDFLLALSDQFSRIGLEHQRSSENATSRDYLTDIEHHADRDLLAHEYVHSWNGKYRRPADLTTAHFNLPMQDSLLWLYEGQTEYWGFVLAARSGLWSVEQARGALADVAARFAHREGRRWRSLDDTTHQPIMAYRRSIAWPNWQRVRDYYAEGQLIWLDVDARLRELSRGRRSLDDFARTFFAADAHAVRVSTYTFDDVVRTLEHIQADDWNKFLRTRVEQAGNEDALGGLARAGWKLVYRDTPSVYQRDVEYTRKQSDFSYSLGFVVATTSGRIEEVLWDSPAFAAGLAASMTIVAVNNEAFTSEKLERAIADAAANKTPIDLLVRNFDRFRSVRIDYHGGLRHPHLERIGGTPDRLGEIFEPRRMPADIDRGMPRR